MTNKNASIRPVVLCGGAGTRLWPLSRKSFPKQFVPLIGNKSLLQLTLERLSHLVGDEELEATVVCVAAEEHRFLVQDAMLAVGVVGGAIILEPAARNTAAAMALAAIHAAPEDLLLFCPADHHIPDSQAFAAMVNQGRPAAEEGAIVTFGVIPTFPSSAYGYIQQGQSRVDGSFQVACFIEKPTVDRAQSLIFGGNVLWNAGIFLVRADTLLTALAQQAPDILKSCVQAMELSTPDSQFIRPGAEAFLQCRSESIDYAVMERHKNVVVMPFNGAWSDVGSWSAMSDLTQPDTQGNRIEGQGFAVDAECTYIYAPDRLVVALGTKELIVVDTPDALLVANRSHSEQVKHVVAALEERNDPQASMHRKVARPWGWYDSIDVGERFQVKRIVVKPGAALSLQKHKHRAEHWVVVKGAAQVTRGGDTFLLTENQSTYIPIGETHRLANPGPTMLEMIEIQTGSYLGEDDIVRLEDSYGRA